MSSYGAGRPTVDDVALLLRARTKDQFGNEVGTFDDDTRPTAAQVEEQIDAAFALILTRLPSPEQLADELLPAVASVVAYRAALRIEKSYFPEQVRSDRSAYDQLLAEYLLDLEALVDAAQSGGPAGAVSDEIGMIPVGSWTSINGPYPPAA
jgi:hypothetical protein